ncbi:hypothetical protein DFQ28_003854 [Apophysomyces sp. BC1034]|nr:hypothetical protein DFQ30_001152 [Apophysomyces sp. BC1015]KAG0182188.1 hypothetical protein DFQ29_005404 [Apophysomyces sp. BC1021]KAG0193681.1 hypothetical protein DFQ28_003854 [Apophysomyces sp. BC1034]
MAKSAAVARGAAKGSNKKSAGKNAPTKVEKPVKKELPVEKVEEEQQSSDDEDSEEEAKDQLEESESESDDEEESEDKEDSDEDSEEEEEEATKEADSDDSDDSEEDEEEEDNEMAEATNDKKRKADDSELDSRPAKKHFGSEGLTVWVGQLSYEASVEDVRSFFTDCGEITDVRVSTDRQTGRSRGFAYVEFATAEGKAAAFEKNGEEHMGRTIKVDEATPSKPRAIDENYSTKSDTVFVANLSHDLTEELVREAFEKFGTIVGEVRLPYNRETEKIRGIGYIQFSSEDEAEAAVKGMNGQSLAGRTVRTDFNSDSDRRPSGGRGGARGGRGGFGGRGGGGFGGRGRGGPRGGGGFGGRGGGRGRGGPRGGFRGGRN